MQHNDTHTYINTVYTTLFRLLRLQLQCWLKCATYKTVISIQKIFMGINRDRISTIYLYLYINTIEIVNAYKKLHLTLGSFEINIVAINSFLVAIIVSLPM